MLEYNFALSDSIQVPGDWNSQKKKLLYYEGTIWYQKSFDHTLDPMKRVYLYFEACNYKAEVYFNEKKLGTHIGGFTPFNFEITDLLKDIENFVVVKVDNTRLEEGVPTKNTDWWNYGGLTRDVKLVEVAPNYIEDYFIQLDQDDGNKIIGNVKLMDRTSLISR